MSFDQIKVELCSFWGGDRDVANAAWASSSDKEKLQLKTEQDVQRLIKQLIELDHRTPKERVWMDFYITAPIFCERELDKYRLSQQFQDIRLEAEIGEFGRWGITQSELSARYRTIPDRAYTLPHDVATIMGKANKYQDRNIKYQNEKSIESYATGHQSLWNWELKRQHHNYQYHLDVLKTAEKANIITNAEYKRAREVLRGELGTAYLTDMRIVLNANALEHILNQRLAKDAQLETRVVAYHMLKEVQSKSVSPVMFTQMAETNGWNPLMEDIENQMKVESMSCVPSTTNTQTSP